MNARWCLLAIFIVWCTFGCNRQKKERGTDVLKFQGSWFLRIFEIDWSDTLHPGKMIPVEGNERYADFTTKIMNKLKKGEISAYDESGQLLSYRKVCLNLVSEGLKSKIDTNKLTESDMLNIRLVGIELNDSIKLDVIRNTKLYTMHSVTLFIPSEFSDKGTHVPVCKIWLKDLENQGFDKELEGFAERKFARKEKIYLPDGTSRYEYTFYLTDAAGVEYYFRIPLETLLADDHLIENSILHYFKDDLVD